MYIDVDVLVGATKMFISISDKLALIKTAKLNKPKVRPYTHMHVFPYTQLHTHTFTSIYPHTHTLTQLHKHICMHIFHTNSHTYSQYYTSSFKPTNTLENTIIHKTYTQKQ